VSDLHSGWTDEPSLDAWLDPGSLTSRVGSAPRVALLAHNPLNAVTGGIWRVSGSDGSVVVKVVTDGRRHEGPDWWAASAVDHHWNSWRREVLVYRSGYPRLLEPDGLGAPALLDERELDDGTVVLVLEDVAGRTGGALTVDDLVAFAAALGRAQGRLAVGGNWDRPWLSRRFLREYAESKPVDDALLLDPAAWREPMVAAHLEPLRGGVESLRARRHELTAYAERCPQTFCHLDAWPANIIRRSDGRFALLDWAFCGHGALGEDVSNLVPDSIFDLLVPHARLDELASRAEAAYVEGVRTGGWHGDARWLRLGIRSPAAKYHWLGARLLVDAGRPRRIVYGGREVDADEFYAARAAGVALLCRWADEALALAGELGLRP
jgi:hypothetical protein